MIKYEYIIVIDKALIIPEESKSLSEKEGCN